LNRSRTNTIHVSFHPTTITIHESSFHIKLKSSLSSPIHNNTNRSSNSNQTITTPIIFSFPTTYDNHRHRPFKRFQHDNSSDRSNTEKKRSEQNSGERTPSKLNQSESSKLRQLTGQNSKKTEPDSWNSKEKKRYSCMRNRFIYVVFAFCFLSLICGSKVWYYF
jgi:hypothetical protein